ncbi:MAG: lipoyl(octanoyl) transferase LipB [Gammaproteobacteria bacterium]|nr:lipoyl(octanoyl) transferase LipB [Gammaproteobacteria bacterium]
MGTSGALIETLVVRDLGLCTYTPIWREMQRFTAERTEDSADELWLLEHESVFTQGQAGKSEHLLAPGKIAVVQSDRGGQVTYHGPGQLVAYLLLDLKRKSIGVRALVRGVETSIIALLNDHGIEGRSRRDAPGVYVEGAKVASVGFRIRRGASFHGLALNVDMDLEPFSRINPCGLPGLPVTQLRDLGGPGDVESVKQPLANVLAKTFGYTVLERI